jgi:hypothetical protein
LGQPFASKEKAVRSKVNVEEQTRQTESSKVERTTTLHEYIAEQATALSAMQKNGTEANGRFVTVPSAGARGTLHV